MIIVVNRGIRGLIGRIFIFFFTFQVHSFNNRVKKTPNSSPKRYWFLENLLASLLTALLMEKSCSWASGGHTCFSSGFSLHLGIEKVVSSGGGWSSRTRAEIWPLLWGECDNEDIKSFYVESPKYFSILSYITKWEKERIIAYKWWWPKDFSSVY